jgi:hypothetical protein
MAILYAFLRKGSNLIPGQVKFNSTTYGAPYGYAAYTCNLGQQVAVDGIPSDSSLSAPNDPRVVTVDSQIKYTHFWYG